MNTQLQTFPGALLDQDQLAPKAELELKLILQHVGGFIGIFVHLL